jgi:hypothetical protein
VTEYQELEVSAVKKDISVQRYAILSDVNMILFQFQTWIGIIERNLKFN